MSSASYQSCNWQLATESEAYSSKTVIMLMHLAIKSKTRFPSSTFTSETIII